MAFWRPGRWPAILGGRETYIPGAAYRDCRNTPAFKARRRSAVVIAEPRDAADDYTAHIHDAAASYFPGRLPIRATRSSHARLFAAEVYTALRAASGCARLTRASRR